jgi:hypothetical protein
VSWPQQAGRLTRFIVPRDAVRAQRFEWWRADDSTARERRRQGGGPYCIGPERSSSRVTACEVRGAAMPYAANILRMLDSAGLSTLAGGDAPTLADTVGECRGDVCGGPAVLVVEIRTPAGYRTYGHTLHLEVDSASRQALRLWQALQPPFP